jgi:anti-sigma factor RsiW
MDVREDDLEMLEAYLDGALSPAETDAINARLRGGGALNDALEELRRQRETRVEAFTRFEPTETETDAVATAILAKARPVVVGRIGRGWRYAIAATAAAACVLIGILIGRAGNTGPAKPSNPDIVAREIYEVALRDQTGKIIAVQQFNSVEEAQQFASDLVKWQQNGNRLASGHFVLTADRF